MSAGPRCRECAKTEQECAFAAGCCEACTHWLAYTDGGDELTVVAPGRRSLPVKEHGTDAGYWQHRVRREPACGPCAYAHLRYKGLTA